MPGMIKVASPVDGRIYAERTLADDQAIAAALERARAAQPRWRQVPVAERAALVERFVAWFEANSAAVAEELTWQMGRPIRYTPGEVRGLAERARYMAGIAEAALQDIDAGPKAGFRRFIRREPLGTVLVLAPWNYPYLTAVNAVVPALLAGNAVILKHSAQTPLCAERFAEALTAAGLPPGVFQALHLDHASVGRLVRDPAIDDVAFTGSVEGGRAIQQAASGRFIGIGLELGGKDPAYVRPDADLAHAVENVVDGAFFNSGQSCCAVERVYVHEAVYDAFVEGAAELTRRYVLDDPTRPETTLGPLVRPEAADFVRRQVADAVAAGARPLIEPGLFAREAKGAAYLAPQILVDVDHGMRLMTEETFGPAVGIMKVASDEQAIALMNDSRYGLTASLWTRDAEAAIAIGDRLATGTCFMNRCDYLDPALAWTGVKDSGRGCTLSRLGFEHLTRPKSFHLRIET